MELISADTHIKCTEVADKCRCTGELGHESPIHVCSCSARWRYNNQDFIAIDYPQPPHALSVAADYHADDAKIYYMPFHAEPTLQDYADAHEFIKNLPQVEYHSITPNPDQDVHITLHIEEENET